MKKILVRLHRADGKQVDWFGAKDEEDAIRSVKEAFLYHGEVIEAFDKEGHLLDVRFAPEDAQRFMRPSTDQFNAGGFL